MLKTRKYYKIVTTILTSLILFSVSNLAFAESENEMYKAARSQFKNKIELREDKINSELNPIQIKRLAMFKNGAGLAEVRIYKAIEVLHSQLEKLNIKIKEKKTDGFDISEFEKKAESIQLDIEAVKIEISGFAPLYQNIESLKLDEIKVNIKTSQALSKSIITDLKKIKADINSLKTEVSAN